MASVADVAAGAAGAGALLGLALTVIAAIAYRRTRGSRNLYLSVAFLLLSVQAGLSAYLLQLRADLPPLWLAVPIAKTAALVLMYLALLRV
ncbi:hypothetical protein BRD56_12895 [Thermoplasmatales archaeon SW_10_69_26]|nr:MAG: hypothetical protein BRD56_12895 [Thermoplasmatales archaeon SW_10_69_26]